MKRLLLSILAVLSCTFSAMAAPIVLPQNVPIFFTYNNLEQVSTANNLVVPGTYAPAAGTQGNWGLLNVSTIQFGGVSVSHTDIAGGPVFFSDDGPGGTQGMITGIFYGINLTGAQTATGGTLDLFWHDAGADLTLGATIPAENACLAGATCGPTAASVAAFASGTFLARLNFANGIINGDPVTTLSSNTNPTINTSGQADGFANVNTSVVGPWTQALNGDWFFVDPNGNGTFGESGETRDLRFSTFYDGLTSWNGTTTANPGAVGLRSNDPARVFTSAVPEPGQLTLLGFALAGLAFLSRRKLQPGA